MRKQGEIPRQHLEKGLGPPTMARSLSVSPGTVSGDLGRGRVAELTWPLPLELDEDVALARGDALAGLDSSGDELDVVAPKTGGKTSAFGGLLASPGRP